MDLLKVGKQSSDCSKNGGKEKEEDYPAPAVLYMQQRLRQSSPSLLFHSRVVFLHILILALFLYFLQVHPYLKPSFAEIIPLVYVFLGGVGDGVLKARN